MPRGAGLAVAAALLLAAGGAVSVSRYSSRFPPPSEIRVPAQGAAGDMFALALGARRLFADLWFVRLMQYYGTMEPEEGGTGEAHEEHAGGHHVHGPACHHGANYGAGRYPLFLPMALHVLELDPSFASAVLYGAGSLAFNMNRANEAKALLAYALRYSPREWRYLSLLAAIGYSKDSDPAEVAARIAPILADPDCPVMLKQLAAFLNKKAGDYGAAVRIYSDIAATSRDQAYVANARRELARLAERGFR